MAAKDSYTIREARADEQTEIVSFIEQYYFPNESINKMYFKKNSHRIDEKEKKIIANDIRSTYTIIVPNVPCLVAIHKESNKIVGLTLMLVEENPKLNGNSINSADKNCNIEISPVTEMPLPFQSKLLDEIATYVVIPAYNSVDLFTEFPSHSSTALKLTFLCVDPDHCRRNLATRLVEEAVNYAENKGIGFVYGLCSSPFSRKATEKNGFQKFSDVDVVKCRDGDGNLIFDGEESYTISMMAKLTQILD